MSRIIVKNLPKKVTEQKLLLLFSQKGHITDLQLKYTKDGVFRQFAFIGYKTEEEAQNAMEYFNNTFIKASKIQVEICADLGGEDKPKSWSKHMKEKSMKNEHESESAQDNIKEKGKEKKFKEEFSEKLQKDKLFAEFIELNKSRISKPLWADDAMELEKKDEDEEEESSDADEDDECPAKNKQLTDMEYLKSKMFTSSKENAGDKVVKEDQLKDKKVDKVFDDCFTVKLKNLPYSCKKKDIKEFFRPLKIESLRLPPKCKGFAYLKFKDEKDMNRALNKNKGFLDGHRILVSKYEKKHDHTRAKREQVAENSEKDMELLAESGRLFVRNLCYTVTQEELEKLFSKFGPITEVHLPIDSQTKKGQGFAFVSYVFAEHAVNAFTKLDGTIFQGRVLHIIPGKQKRENTEDIDDLPFKKKKEKKLKALSGSSHNWNTLFLGLNAVADVMSEKYKVKKSDLLNDDRNESIAVRMALGETQLVVETRQFLLKNGVQLDAFSQPAGERSKTVIIAKNLPANTSEKELYDTFSQHGLVSRIILPPAGITALIEFEVPTEAKIAFTKLAYSKFRHLPLYLEWAPMNVFKADEPKPSISESKESVDGETIESKPVDETACELEPEPETTLFVKNLNFDTDEDTLRKHFKKCGPLHSVTISMKKDINKGKLLSMGFGFVQFKRKSSAVQSLQELQHSMLDGHKLELKFSNRANIIKAGSSRQKANVQEQKSSKILVRNIPFEVTEREIRDLFKEFGELKSVRLPRKFSTEGTHRGFGFVEFASKANAKCAFDALCHSTHLLGRRLVLEWAYQNSEDVTELRKKTAKDFYAEGPKAKLKKSKLRDDILLESAKV